VAAEDVAGWAEALASLLDGPDRARERAALGLARAAQFSWDRAARETAAVYQAALERPLALAEPLGLGHE
jgi:alpha-1,3-rhamnosyl/mannosyltransferase